MALFSSVCGIVVEYGGVMLFKVKAFNGRGFKKIWVG